MSSTAKEGNKVLNEKQETSQIKPTDLWQPRTQTHPQPYTSNVIAVMKIIEIPKGPERVKGQGEETGFVAYV